MGPSVKFVLAIIDSISKKKMGVNFFIRKKTIRNTVFFPEPFPYIVIMRMMKDMKVPATYVGGLICLCTYYRALHPKGRMPNPAHTAKIL